MDEIIRILLVEDTKEIAELIDSQVKEQTDIDYEIDWYPQLAQSPDGYYDINIVSDSNGNLEKSVRLLRSSNNRGSIFALSYHTEDVSFLKRLLALKIEWFLDKKNLDVEPLVQSVKKCLKTRNKLECLTQKLKELETVSSFESSSNVCIA